MPQDNRRNTIARQWELLRLLPSKGPGRTARELTGALADLGFDVSKRTVERDLRDLSVIFPLCRNDHGIPHGWYWMPGEHPNIPALPLSEALSLILLEEHLRPLLPTSLIKALEPQFRHARSKLDAMSDSSPLARWINKVRNVQPSLPLCPPVIDETILEMVQQALLDERQIAVDYDAPSGRKELQLHPLALVQRGPVSYLVATAWDYPDLRLYALHRIRSARTTEASLNRPKDFDLDTYIEQGALHFSTGSVLCLRAKVSEELARILEETPLSSDMKLQRKGNDRVITANLPDSWQLRWWLLSQGPDITVLSPDFLRDEIARMLEQARSNYD